MTTTLPTPIKAKVDYPTGDGQPMAETPVHGENLSDTIASLDDWYVPQDRVYISGNMFVYYVKGNKLKHLAPDVFLVLGVPRRERDCYKTWEEPVSRLDLVIEFTSRSTADEDLEQKFEIYRDEIRVREYLIFDPYEEYLDPPQQLYRLRREHYEPVIPVDGRLPSEVLGLHFDRSGKRLRLYNPDTGLWLPTPRERAEHAAEQARQATERLQGVVAEREQAATALAQAQAEIQRLRQQLDALRGGPLAGP
ncbi:MAG TPA: Uma2 family endonuclease [Planctomycetaceae bacterium]|nr:Uma2 family endonuclease [Planctomycetaceae bacterium]